MLLAALMVLGMLPTVALAASAPTVTYNGSSSVTAQKVGTFSNAAQELEGDIYLA